MANKIKLPNGWYYSEPAVFPKDWKTARASVAVSWYVKFRFYEPGYKPVQVLRRCGNEVKNAEARREVVRDTLQEIKDHLNIGWNPRLAKTYLPQVAPGQPNGTIGPESSLARSLAYIIIKRKKGGMRHETIREICSYSRRFVAWIKANIGKDTTAADLKHRHVIEALDGIAHQYKWGPASFNNARAYLHSLFEDLVTYEVCDFNPVHRVKARAYQAKPRKILSPADRKRVVKALQAEPAFYRAVQIFYTSGAREIELCHVKGKDVDLAGQTFTVEIKKGSGPAKRTVKAITDVALPFWEEQLQNCGPDDYVFSKNFLPGPNFYKGARFNRWWKELVKDALGIEADFYALKHLHTTEVAAENEQMAADFNSHTSTKMNAKHYDVMGEARRLEERKKSKAKL